MAIKDKFFAAATAFWNQYLPQLAATGTTSTPTQAATPSTTAAMTQKPQSLESNYMIATFVLLAVAVLLLAIVIVLVYRMNKAKNKYVE